MKKITLLLAIVMIVNLLTFAIPTVTFAETDNIAVGKPTTGTTQYDAGGGFHPAKATDGDHSTRWARGSHKVEGNTPNDMIKEWVQIDLEQPYPIDKVVAHTQLSDSSGYAGYLMVQLSNDPTFKTNTSKMITLEKGEPNEITTPWIANYKSEVAYRYVRLGRNSTAWVSITEIEVYPMDIVDPNSAVYSDIEGSEYEGAIKILRKLGINYAAKTDEYGVNLLMNRSTAVENIIKLFYEDPARISSGEMPFADIDKSMSCYDSVIAAYDAGIVNEDYAEVAGESIKAISSTTHPWMVVESLDTIYHNERECYQVTGYDLTGKSTVSYIIDGIEYMAETGLIYQDHGPSKSGNDNWHTQWYAIKPKSVNEAPETEKAKYISNIDEIGRGDVIRYEISGSYIRNIERVYKFDETVKPVQAEQAWKTSNSNYPNHQFAVHRFQFATVADIDAKMVRLKPIVENSTAEPYMKGYFGKIMFVSADSDKKVEVQAVNELANYKGDNYRVLFYCNSGAPKSAVVYEYK